VPERALNIFTAFAGYNSVTIFVATVKPVTPGQKRKIARSELFAIIVHLAR
jgi:hypothetical protein